MTSILVDSASKCLLAASSGVSGPAFLNGCMPDTYFVSWAERPHYVGQDFDKLFVEADYPKWSWVRRKRRFVPTNPDVLNDNLFARSRLAMAKLRAVEEITRHLNTSRNRLFTGLILQDTIYMIKFIEAMRFIESGYDEKRILEFPYVLQYSEFAEIPLRQAADDIYLKARLDSHFLLNTEALRLKYFKIIKAAETPADLNGVTEAFRLECFNNAMV